MPSPSPPRRMPFLLLAVAIVAAVVALGIGALASVRETGAGSPAGLPTDRTDQASPSGAAAAPPPTASPAPTASSVPATGEPSSGSSSAGPAAASGAPAPWFGGYADVTVKPLYPSNDSGAGGGKTVLAFIIADPDRPCEPSWGGQYSLDSAASEISLDQRVALLRQQGQGLAISFGGASGDELATACTDPQALAQAYEKVIDRYAPDVVDFDIEARNLADSESTARRAQALREAVDHERPSHSVQVWLTLPVTAKGLAKEGKAVVSKTLQAGVDLAGVNIMTMDFEGPATGQQMLDTAIQAANSAHTQLSQLFPVPPGQGASAVWRKLGLTPMIGRNDVPGQTFDLQAAAGLNAFAHEKGIGRLSMWSLNRDRACGAGEAPTQGGRGGSEAADTCSAVDQAQGSFAGALSAGFRPAS